MNITVIENNQMFLGMVRRVVEALQQHQDEVADIWPELASKLEGTEFTFHDNFPEGLESVKAADVVVTDLSMPPDKIERRGEVQMDFSRWEPYFKAETEPPMGILIVLEAVAAGKRCILATDGDHHGEKNSWLYDGYLRLMERMGQYFEYEEVYKGGFFSAEVDQFRVYCQARGLVFNALGPFESKSLEALPMDEWLSIRRPE